MLQMVLCRQKLKILTAVWLIPRYNKKISIQNQTCYKSNLVSETAQNFARNSLVTWSYSLNSIGKHIDVKGAGLSPHRITCSHREMYICNPFFIHGWLINRLRSWMSFKNNLIYLFYNGCSCKHLIPFSISFMSQTEICQFAVSSVGLITL